MDSEMLMQYDNKVAMYHYSTNLIHTQL